MKPQEQQYDIFHDVFIKAPMKQVFQAISDPDQLTDWWPLKCSGKPKKGEVYNFYFTPEYDWYGKVIHCIQDRTFHIGMIKADEDWNPTSFGFDLEEVPNGTQVHFWHKGWPRCNHHFRRSSWCWALLLKGLKDYLEKGVVVPFAERE